MTAARRAELRALVLAAVDRLGRASLRRLEQEIACRRSTLAAIVRELAGEGLLVQVPGHGDHLAWSLPRGAPDCARVVPSGARDSESPERVSIVPVVTDPISRVEDRLRTAGISPAEVAAAVAQAHRIVRAVEELRAAIKPLDEIARAVAIDTAESLGEDDLVRHDMSAIARAAVQATRTRGGDQELN